MRAKLIFVFVVTAAIAAPAGVASASETSDGCQGVSGANFDGISVSGGVSGMEFSTGETLTATVDEPFDFGTPVAVTLHVNGALVDQSAFPGTVTFTVPEDGPYVIGWSVAGGNGTWDVTCAAPQPAAAEVGNARQVANPWPGHGPQVPDRWLDWHSGHSLQSTSV